MLSGYGAGGQCVLSIWHGGLDDRMNHTAEPAPAADGTSVSRPRDAAQAPDASTDEPVHDRDPWFRRVPVIQNLDRFRRFS